MMKKNFLHKVFTSRFIFTWMIVLFLSAAASAQLVAVTGSYDGDGEDDHAIEGLGFKPDFLLINSNQYHAQLCSFTFPANSTKDMYGGQFHSGRIISLDIDGFTLGDDNKVNKNGTAYNYLAFKKEAGVLEMGSYTGNGTDNRDIVCTGFKPDMVIIISEDNSEKPVFSTFTMGEDNTMNFLNSSYQSDRIQAFNPHGFQVGKNKAVNANGKTYHYLAIKNETGKINIGSYDGDGTQNHVISNLGYSSFVLVKRNGKNALHRNRDMQFDRSYYFKNSNSVSSRIKKNTSNGFELGNSDEVNEIGEEYHFFQIDGLSNILPVKLLSFKARLAQQHVDLVWKTGAGSSFTSIEVERSQDQTGFNRIAVVEGSGNGNDTVSYIYTDTQPLHGNSYYRLKMISSNGSIKYSGIRKIFFNEVAKSEFSFSPNPLPGNKLEIHYSHQEHFININIVNLNGVRADNQVLTNGNRYLFIKNSLPPGIYYLIGDNGKSVLFNQKLVKL